MWGDGMKAWLCTCMGVSGIVFAETRSKARYTTIREARDAGWKCDFTEPCSVVRAPQYDCLLLSPRHGWTTEHVDRELSKRAACGVRDG